MRPASISIPQESPGSVYGIFQVLERAVRLFVSGDTRAEYEFETNKGGGGEHIGASVPV